MTNLLFNFVGSMTEWQPNGYHLSSLLRSVIVMLDGDLE